MNSRRVRQVGALFGGSSAKIIPVHAKTVTIMFRIELYEKEKKSVKYKLNTYVFTLYENEIII